jgi:hypothetical protein
VPATSESASGPGASGLNSCRQHPPTLPGGPFDRPRSAEIAAAFDDDNILLRAGPCDPLGAVSGSQFWRVPVAWLATDSITGCWRTTGGGVRSNFMPP